MQRLLSTYLFVSRKLTPELLGQIAGAGFEGVENLLHTQPFRILVKYGSSRHGRRARSKPSTARLAARSTSRDVSAMRESGMPLSICEVERVRRIEAMDELKRVSTSPTLALLAAHPSHGRLGARPPILASATLLSAR